MAWFALMSESDCLASAPEPESVSFRFQLLEGGWASLDTIIGGRTFSIPAFGYLTDGLGDLVRAALQIATGEGFVGVLFDEEPQCWGLALEPAGLTHDNRRIARLTMRDGQRFVNAGGRSDQPVWEWATEPVLDGYAYTDEFARAVQVVAAHAREQYDDKTYRQRWGHFGSLEGFPR